MAVISAAGRWRAALPKVIAAIWIGAVVLVSLQAAANHNNNFEIFRSAWMNLLDGRDLYGSGERHFDLYKYSPTFALLFAPFAVLPFAAGIMLWNAVNAGALYWGLGRILTPDQALAARAIVLMDTVGAMQNVQSNALVAGLMVIAFADLEQRRELRGALAVTLGTAVKLFPIIASLFALFHPRRIPRFAAWGLMVGVLAVAAPLLVLSPSELRTQYGAWIEISRVDAFTRGFSVMEHLHRWLGVEWPNWPIQVSGLAILVAPLARRGASGGALFRLLFLASVLMYCVLFNHKAESPTFVVAMAGVAVWFVATPRSALTWSLFAVVLVGTVLSSSDLMPKVVQNTVFEPYRLKTLPVLLVWAITQRQLWSAPSR